MRKQRGFTLIELLVVVTIIALLIAILIPSLGRARDRAKIAACASNLKQIGTGAALYATDYNAFYPPEYERGFADYYFDAPPQPIGTQICMYVSGPHGNSGLATLLASGQVSDGRVFFCPAIPFKDSQGIQKAGPINDAGKLASDFTYNKHLGYFYQPHTDLNPSYLPENPGTTFSAGTQLPNPPSVQPIVIPPATTPATTPLSGANGLFLGAAWPKNSVSIPSSVFFVSDLIVGPLSHGAGSGANGGFFDGHVEYIDSGAFRKSYLHNSWDSNTIAFSKKLNSIENQSMHQK